MHACAIRRVLSATARVCAPCTRSCSFVSPRSLADLDAVRAGQQSLTDHAHGLLEHVDKVNPHVLALLPEADRKHRVLNEVASLERRQRAGERMPLYGAAVAVKDVFSVDGLPTRGGSQLPPHVLTMPEAPCVTVLRTAGCYVIGKAVTTEFAGFSASATRNPYAPEHTPGGSSSGSAASVASGMAHLALGTQTVGSVVRPASFCGIVGFKPSFGSIATSPGLLYFSRSVDTVGAFASDVRGILEASEVLLGSSNHDPKTTLVCSKRPTVGVPEGPYLESMSAIARQAFEQTLAKLKNVGYECVRARVMEDWADIRDRHYDLTTAEFGEEHCELFAEYGALYSGGNSEIMYKATQMPPARRKHGESGRLKLRGELHTSMCETGIDLWLCPAAADGHAPEGLRSTGSPIANLPWSHAGMPALTLPVRSSISGQSMPTGLQVVGRFGEDSKLLRYAQQLEAALRLA